MQPPISLHALITAFEIEQFHSKTFGILSVGSPTGSLTRTADGSFLQTYTFGSIIKPLDQPAFLHGRFLATLELAGVRCFGTDDPDGTDKPYLVISVYAHDPSRPEEAVQTIKIGPEDIGEISPPQVFAQGRSLVDRPFFVPGDGTIRIHVKLFDQENGDPEDIKNKTSTALQVAMAAAITAIPLIGPPAAVLAKSSGILDSVGDAFGGLLGDLFGDDLIDQHDFVVDNQFLSTARDQPETLHRKSDSIPGASYNSPQLKEDGSPEGRSWLFDRGPGKGTYRVFFGFRVAEVTFPPV
jgi:hypothetical protein